MKDFNYQDCFTAGELAAIFGISKQTLLYYDRIGLLSPAFISNNGYRHYSIPQYLDLEIIVGLRSLNMPVASIKAYLENRSPEHLATALTLKDQEAQAIIKENQRIRTHIASINKELVQLEGLAIDKPALHWREERFIRITSLPEGITGKEKIARFASHYYRTQHSKAVPGHLVGWQVPLEDFFSDNTSPRSQTYFSFSPASHQHRKEKELLPEGLYLELYFHGTFCRHAAHLAQLIKDFLEPRGLSPKGKIHVLPQANHWLYLETDAYITQLFLQVQEKRS